ncbi:MAG: WecB/TagA/CpsF family glycosyltransferase [Bacillota bacterium]|jgi:N-acetylglucosaminyldiphosphoundecaprenol N-acetyl-beta-D-mannosaminyltransferase
MVKILGVRVDNVDMVQSLCLIQEYIDCFSKNKKKNHIITLNAEIIYRAKDDVKLKEIINKAELVTPDGSGVVWASQQLGEPLSERVTGIDLLAHLCRQAQPAGWKLYFFGSKPGVAQAAKAKIEEGFPNINIVGVHDGYFTPEEEPSIIADINDKKPDILFVALGAPKQEFWINENRDKLDVAVMMGVGGSFDVISGNVKRAPVFFQKLRLEWLWRLLSNPSRAGRMKVLPKFVKLVKKSKKERKRNQQEVEEKRGQLPS